MRACQPGLEVSQPCLKASQPSLKASQPRLWTSQPGLRAFQPGLRASHPGLRASQPGWGGTDGRTENLPILQDFLPYRYTRAAAQKGGFLVGRKDGWAKRNLRHDMLVGRSIGWSDIVSQYSTRHTPTNSTCPVYFLLIRTSTARVQRCVPILYNLFI